MNMRGLSANLREALDAAQIELREERGASVEVTEAIPGGAAFGGRFESSHTIKWGTRGVTLWPEDEELTWLEYTNGEVSAAVEIRSDVAKAVAQEWFVALLMGSGVLYHGLLRKGRHIELRNCAERLSLTVV